MRRFAWCVGVVGLLVTGGCTSIAAYSQQQLALQQDVETCSLYGADRRSAAYVDCMLVQQERHDAATRRQTALIADGNDVIAGRH